MASAGLSPEGNDPAPLRPGTAAAFSRRSSVFVTPAMRSVILFLAAFLIRFVFFAEITAHPLFDVNVVPGTDMHTLTDWGREIAAGDWGGRKRGAFWQAPLYPYLLGLVFRVTGCHLEGAALVQAILGAATCVLVYWLGRLTFSEAVGVIAGGLTAIYGLLIFFGGILHSTTLEVFLATAGLLALVRADRDGGWLPWLGAGLLWGLAALARPNFLLFIAAAGFLPFLRRPPLPRRAALCAAAFLLGAMAAIAPVTARNWVVGRQFVLISASGRETFRIANSYDSVPLNFIYPKKPPMPILSGAFWSHQARKALLFWDGFEPPQNVNYYFFRWHLPALRWPLLPFWLAAPLGLVGMVLAGGDRRRLLPLYLFAGTYFLSVVAFFVIARFRLPLVPVLLVFAAFALVRIAEALRAGRPRVALLSGLAVLVLALAARPGAGSHVYPPDLAVYGYILANRGRLPEAIALLGRAVEAWPDNVRLSYDLGSMLLGEGRYPEALTRFEAVLRIDPAHPGAWRRAGLAVYLAGGDRSRAAEFLRKAISLDPQGPGAAEARRVLAAVEQGETIRMQPGSARPRLEKLP